MITGDFPATARTIAAEAGIPSSEVVTGDDLREASPDLMQKWARTVSVFARVRPEQKLQLVDALLAIGETVAMMGDGVNDAPALKSADIGIAMGKRGTDVAREAAGIVLLEEDFGRIIEGIRLGRRIFDNLRKVILHIAAVHVPIAGLGFLPVVFGMPIAIWPLHVVVLEMVVNSVCSLAFGTRRRSLTSCAVRRAGAAKASRPCRSCSMASHRARRYLPQRLVSTRGRWPLEPTTTSLGP